MCWLATSMPCVSGRFAADQRGDSPQAANRESAGIYLADAEDAFARASDGGAPGKELFYEHVHLNFEGNYLLARTVFEQLVRILPESRACSYAIDQSLHGWSGLRRMASARGA